MSLGSFVIFQGSGPVAKETIFCDILEGVLWIPPPHLDPRMAWMQSETGHYYVWLDLGSNCLHKNHFGKILPGTSSMDQHQTLRCSDADQAELFMSGLISVQTVCKSNNQLFQERGPMACEGETVNDTSARHVPISIQDYKIQNL